MEHRLSFKGFDGDDVPDVFRDDVSGEEVDVVFGVVVAITSGFHDVLSTKVGACAFDLHSPETSSDSDQSVVWIGFSPRFGETETQASGAGEELGFRGFSQTLAVGVLGVGVSSISFSPIGRFVLSFPHDKKGAAGWLRPDDSFLQKNGQKTRKARPEGCALFISCFYIQYINLKRVNVTYKMTLFLVENQPLKRSWGEPGA